MIITPTSLTITQLLGSQNEQYVIPAYQRRYSWQEKQLWELIDDISLIEGADTHLLGSIVCLTGHHTAGINKLELVDGQQRITTISVLLLCILERLKSEGEHAEAQDIERLLQAKALGGTPVRKIALDSLDQPEYEKLAGGGKVDHAANANLATAFSTFRDWVSKKDLSDLGTFLYRLKNQAIVIRLDVSDAKDAFKLFETINNRGLKLSPTDIIKNFLLGNAARFGPPHLELARTKWAELISQLDGTSFDSFFRHYLCAKLKRRITVSYVIPNFKTVFMQQVSEAATLPERHWYNTVEPSDDESDDSSDVSEDLVEPVSLKTPKVSFSDFLDDLVHSSNIFGQIARARSGNATIDRHLRNLRMIKAQQTYGFLMVLRVGGCSDSAFIEVLQLTESLLVRRHICRERANENETAFARLCGVDCANPLPEVIATFRALTPTDEKFRYSFSSFEFTANLIERARYCLEQLENQAQGKHVELIVGGPDLVHVEHIIPQKIKTKRAKDEFGDWPAYLGKGSEMKHARFVSQIGNLTLIAGPLNMGASNGPYDKKKSAYANSAISLTKRLPVDYSEFRFEQVEARGADLADRAVVLWPIP